MERFEYAYRTMVGINRLMNYVSNRRERKLTKIRNGETDPII
jgi:hypothetical protein